MENTSSSLVEETIGSKLCGKYLLKRRNCPDWGPEEEKINYFSRLPPDLQIKIFLYLDKESLSRANQVCRHWYQITLDSIFYRKVEIETFNHQKQLDTFNFFIRQNRGVRELYYFFNHKFSSENETDVEIKTYLLRRLADFLDMYKENLKSLKIVFGLNKEVLSKINLCERLTTLDLTKFRKHWSGSTFDELWQLTKLEKLILTDMHMSGDFLVPLLNLNRNLEVLELVRCFSSTEDLDQIFVAIRRSNVKLKSFYFGGDGEITDLGLAQFANWSNLENLQIHTSWNESTCNRCLENIAEGCPNLKKLRINYWDDVSENALLLVPCILKNLTDLNLSYCYPVTVALCKNILASLPKLKTLTVNGCALPLSDVDELRELYSNAHIEHNY